jgi:hypothetical protein
MGIKKAGKRLLKLGQKAAKTLGREGKQRVEEFFANAIEILERELETERGGKASKKATAKGTARPRRRPEVGRRATQPKPRAEAVGRRKKTPGPAQRPRPASARTPALTTAAAPEPRPTATVAQVAPRSGSEGQQAP